MRKLFLAAAALSLVLGLSGCTQTEEPPNPEEPIVNANPGAENPDTPSEAILPDYLTGLTQDEYDGIKISGAVLRRMAILPGNAIPVNVVVENTGDKTIAYVQGSGVWTTPQSLTGASDNLQYVIPRDNLGIATMDYVVKELKPGESVTFDVFFMAIQPSENFNDYTYEQFNGNQTYIADMNWEELTAAYPDLMATAEGSYEAHLYLRYSVMDEGGNPVTGSDPTGYAEAIVPIGVS